MLFRSILIHAGEPFTVPPNITRDQIPHYVAELEARMAALTALVEQQMHPEKAAILAAESTPAPLSESVSPPETQHQAA